MDVLKNLNFSVRKLNTYLLYHQITLFNEIFGDKSTVIEYFAGYIKAEAPALVSSDDCS